MVLMDILFIGTFLGLIKNENKYVYTRSQELKTRLPCGWVHFDGISNLYGTKNISGQNFHEKYFFRWILIIENDIYVEYR